MYVFEQLCGKIRQDRSGGAAGRSQQPGIAGDIKRSGPVVRTHDTTAAGRRELRGVRRGGRHVRGRHPTGVTRGAASVTTEPTPAELETATTGVTAASLAIADYGSVVLRADEHGSEPISLFTDHHVAVVHEDDIVPDMPAAFDWFGETLRESRDSAIIATGPSATADMGALVQGAHGPKTVEVLALT
ncbi:hypothetical protein BRD19_08355 [Halobacteriales archaeon SW_7_65_23]|nr:MAG: hypothetical protein BRD19_08355 [Halobacteriales archaeon SW_7_65_23]